MDTSETYIKMRLAAIPDLGMGMPPDLTPIELVGFKKVFIDVKGDSYYSDEKQVTQLEHQDQLQDKLWRGYCEGANIKVYTMDMKLTSLIAWLHDFYRSDGDFSDFPKSNKAESSMEQLWLQLLMAVLYGKIWNGEDWVNG
jgi:hypothetical protein